jgi:hypothetical protein
MAVIQALTPLPGMGESVEVAGYGLTASHAVRQLNFLVETVVDVSPDMITVDGFGKDGACEGDSGAPLIVRAPSGDPQVVGILSTGDATCVGEDEYVRLDAVGDWLAATLGQAVMSDSEDLQCGQIGSAGRCFSTLAVRCSNGELAAATCMSPQECGWDVSTASFRCVEPQVDPCDGVDDVGACVSGEALRCVEGVLVRQSCGPCGACRVDGQTGSPLCAVAGSEND